MIEQKSFDASYEKSRQLVKGRLKLTALPAAVYIGCLLYTSSMRALEPEEKEEPVHIEYKEKGEATTGLGALLKGLKF